MYIYTKIEESSPTFIKMRNTIFRPFVSDFGQIHYEGG